MNNFFYTCHWLYSYTLNYFRYDMTVVCVFKPSTTIHPSCTDEHPVDVLLMCRVGKQLPIPQRKRVHSCRGQRRLLPMLTLVVLQSMVRTMCRECCFTVLSLIAAEYVQCKSTLLFITCVNPAVSASVH